MVAPLIISHAQEIADLCRRHDVMRLAIFGSAGRSDFRQDSDVDFLVEFDPAAEVGMIEFLGIRQELQDLLGRAVDLVTPRSLRPQLRDEILASATVLYAK